MLACVGVRRISAGSFNASLIVATLKRNEAKPRLVASRPRVIIQYYTYSMICSNCLLHFPFHLTRMLDIYDKRATMSDNNIGQLLAFPPYPLPNVVLQVQKNIERKVDIIVATLKEGKLGRAFF